MKITKWKIFIITCFSLILVLAIVLIAWYFLLGPDQEEYKVYDAIINTMDGSDSNKISKGVTTSCYLVQFLNQDPQNFQNLLHLKPSLGKEDSHIVQNAWPQPPWPSVPAGGLLGGIVKNNFKSDVTIISPNTFSKLLKQENNLENAWNKFYALYPNIRGHIQFSRVAFLSNREEAIVYVIWQGGSMDAWSGYFLLKKSNGKWKRLEFLCTGTA
ncbi:MAG TPA: hypothetical protein DCZ94_19280 [Lentisphaeria bacterium]|nr:MAG: hypothetical protein A2X48_01525 [Lentisphaerae bacterium GWF2_49_21]HBC89087.1 hypothetical protein [Lentisphaeria bacterium]